MRTQRTAHRRWSVVILVLFCAAGIHQGGAAQVLCIGEDGHVEVELPREDCCTDSGEAHAREQRASVTSEAASHGDDCGACIDIPIVTSGHIAVKSSSVDRTDACAGSLNTIVAPVGNIAFNSQSTFAAKPAVAPNPSAPLPLLI